MIFVTVTFNSSCNYSNLTSQFGTFKVLFVCTCLLKESTILELTFHSDLPRSIIDQGIFKQSQKYESDAEVRPDIYGLSVCNWG